MKTELSEPIPLSPDVLRMIVNLEKELRSQNERIEQIETKIAQVEKNLKILIDELRRGGYINLPERRKVLKRSILDQEALMNLLKKKGVISKREFLREIQQLLKRERASGNAGRPGNAE